MPEETFDDLLGLLGHWVDETPETFRRELGDRLFKAEGGERHGSWFFRLTWTEDGLAKIAEIFLTNPGPNPDSNANSVILSARSAASTQNRYVLEALTDEKRSIKRIRIEDLVSLLNATINRAIGYTETSLSQAYVTGLQVG